MLLKKIVRLVFISTLGLSLLFSCNLFFPDDSDSEPEQEQEQEQGGSSGNGNPDSGIEGLTVNLDGAKAFVTKSASSSRSLSSNGFISRSIGESPLVKILEDGSIEDVLSFPGDISIPDITFIAISKDGSIYVQFSYGFSVGDSQMQFIKINKNETIEVIEANGSIDVYNYSDTTKEPIAFSDDGGIFYAINYYDSKGLRIKKYLNGNSETIVDGEHISIRSFFTDGIDIFVLGSNSSSENNSVFLRRYRKGEPLINIFYNESGNCWIRDVVRHGGDLILHGHSIPDPINKNITYDGLLKLVKTDENEKGYKWISITGNTTDSSTTNTWKKSLNKKHFLKDDGSLDKALLNKVYGRYFEGKVVPDDIDLFSEVELNHSETYNTSEEIVFYNKLFSRSSKYIEGSYTGGYSVSINREDPDAYLQNIVSQLYETYYFDEYSLGVGLTKEDTNKIIEKIKSSGYYSKYFDSIKIKAGVTSFPEKIEDYKVLFADYLDCTFANKKASIPSGLVSYSGNEAYAINKELLGDDNKINETALYKALRDKVISCTPQSVKFKDGINLSSFPITNNDNLNSVINNYLTITPREYFGGYNQSWDYESSKWSIPQGNLNSDQTVRTEEVLDQLKKFEADANNPNNYFKNISIKNDANLGLFPNVILKGVFKCFLDSYFDIEWGKKPVSTFEVNNFFDHHSRNDKYIISESKYARLIDGALGLFVSELKDEVGANSLSQKSNDSYILNIDSEFSKEELYKKIVWKFEDNDQSQVYAYTGILGEFRITDDEENIINFIYNFFDVTYNDWDYDSMNKIDNNEVFYHLVNNVYTQHENTGNYYYYTGIQDIQNFLENDLDYGYIKKPIIAKTNNGIEVKLTNVFSYDEIYNRIEWKFEGDNSKFTYDKVGALGEYRVVDVDDNNSNFLTNFFNIEFSAKTFEQIENNLKNSIYRNIFTRRYYPFKYSSIEDIKNAVIKNNETIKELDVLPKVNNGKSLEITDYVSYEERFYKVYWQFEENDPSKDYPYEGILGKFRHNNHHSSSHFFENFFTYKSEAYDLESLGWQVEQMIKGSNGPYNFKVHSDVFKLRDIYINEDKSIKQNLIDEVLRQFFVDPSTFPKVEKEIDRTRFLDPSDQGTWVKFATLKFKLTSEIIKDIPDVILKNDFYLLTQDFYTSYDYYNLNRFIISDNGDITGLFKIDNGNSPVWNISKILENNTPVSKPIFENIKTNMLKLYSDTLFYADVNEGVYSLKSLNINDSQKKEIISSSNNLELYKFDAALNINKLFFTALSYNENVVKLGTVDLLTNNIKYTDKKDGIGKGSDIKVYAQE